MVRVSASLSAHSAQPAAQLASAAALHSSSTTTGRTQLQPARLVHPGSGCAQQLMPVQTHHQQQQLSLEVTEDQEVPGVGRFTAYADGRVRVLFADRTILRLDADRAQAKLILPDGSKQEVPVSRPLGVEEYVQVGPWLGVGRGWLGGSAQCNWLGGLGVHSEGRNTQCAHAC
jgi:hypothetical protein